MKRAPLSARELFWTSFLMMFPTMLLILPGDLLRMGGRYAWGTPLVAGLPAVALVGLIGSRAGRSAGLHQALDSRFGAVFGRIALAAILAALAVYTTLSTREYAGLALSTFVFQDVPIWVLTVLGLIIAGAAASLGPTVIARGAEVVAPLLLAVTVLLLLAALPFSHFLWALPLWPRSTAFTGLRPISETWVWLVEPLALTLLLEHVQPEARAHAGSILAASAALAALMTAVGLWVIVADFGPVRASQFVLPFFGLSKDMTFGSFLQHFEVLLIPVALLGGTGKMAIFYWLFARTGQLLTAGGIRIWLLVGLVGIGFASIVAFPNVAVLSAFLRTTGERLMMPALVAGFIALVLLRRGVRS